jgi:hypothetical protein
VIGPSNYLIFVTRTEDVEVRQRPLKLKEDVEGAFVLDARLSGNLTAARRTEVMNHVQR